MKFGRALPHSVAILLLLAGCASMQNTLAQDMAWQAWNTCPHAPTMWLNRIDPDGKIWVNYGGGSQGITEWQQCIQKYYADLAAQKSAVAPPPPQMAQASAAALTGAILPPVWKPGDEWAYRYESPAGSGTYVWSVDREEAIDGVPHYVIKTGTRELFYRKSDFASTRETVDRAVVLNNKPSRLQLVWPLEIGKSWEQAYVEEHPAARQTLDRVDTVTVEAEETVTVPAATFKTLKVVYRNKKTNTTRYEAWYSLDIKQVVKLRENLETGVRVRELIAFKLR